MILADELAADLDRDTVEAVTEGLLAAAGPDVTLVVATHNAKRGSDGPDHSHRRAGMKALLQILRLMLAGQRRSLIRGAALVMGVALLGLSGWFITAATAAELTGAGGGVRHIPPLSQGALPGAWPHCGALWRADADP